MSGEAATRPVDPSQLVATTRRLPAERVDLVGEAGPGGVLWHDPHGGLAGSGEALRLTLPGGLADDAAVRAVVDTLAAIPTDDAVGLPGCGPVALGALAFDPRQAGTLVVPRRVVGRVNDDAWETVISGNFDVATALTSRRAHESESDADAPDEFRLAPGRPHTEWRRVVADAVAHVQTGALQKVVLARCVDVTANRPFVVRDVLARLIALYPSCMVFSVDGFIGASPELLIRRIGAEVTSHPLAGTVARSGDVSADEALVAGLLASPKERSEHQLVVDALADDLRQLCATLDVPDTPSIVGLRNVSHLGTFLTGQIADTGDRRPTALELVARVHPTPAVGGWPTAAAVAYLQSVEGFDRARYAGPVGWVDSRGDGVWAVGIRSADVRGVTARMYAGGGIVADSEPAAELAETQLKLQALLSALVRP